VTTSDVNGNDHDGSFPHRSGAEAFATASNDPGELRALLAHARDRLSFYEGFDRVIAENVRRSGELMLEMLTMRDAMTASAERDNREQQERIAASLADLEAGLQAIRAQADRVGTQVASLRQSLETAGGHPATAAGPAGPAAVPEPDLEPRSAAIADPGGWAAPRVVDVIAHHVTRATVALSLQRHLGALDTVSGVEAREFAEGVLRMQVTASQPLGAADLDGWTDNGPVSILRLQPDFVEISLAPNP
jgi:hypothetical protein